MAFQIVDDVLDLTATEDVLGKPVASDLREGKVTMAVIHALERCTQAEREAIETVLRERAFNGVTHREIIAILNAMARLKLRNARPCNMRPWQGTPSAVSPTAKSSAHSCGRRSLWWQEKSSGRRPFAFGRHFSSRVPRLHSLWPMRKCQRRPPSLTF